MLKTASPLTPAEFKKYAQTARDRAAARRKQLEARRAQAWEVARRGATLLKKEFGAKRVVLFGSLPRGPSQFHAHSDIDLAVWGLDERFYLRAVGRLLDLDPKFEVDLLETEFARPALQKAIERDGIEL
jgi:predicted nucleotidyltransferase